MKGSQDIDIERSESAETFRDPWDAHNDQKDYKKWKDMTNLERFLHVLTLSIKLVLVLACLYLFICALSIMGSSFQVLAGRTAGKIFQQGILANPIAGLIIGILVTVLVQSSSTSTSIVVTMVGAGIVEVKEAIPIIMGANIGTSVTNTIVSLAQAMDQDQFRRAFAGATVHDIFNLLSVLILLPIEVISGYLRAMTGAIVKNIFSASLDKTPDILKVITNPLTKKIVQVDKDIIKKIAKNQSLGLNDSILKRYCKPYDKMLVWNLEERYRVVTSVPMLSNSTNSLNSSAFNQTFTETYQMNISEYETVKLRCDTSDYLFAKTTISEAGVGVILLVLSLLALCICLLCMVKLLHSTLKGGVAKVIKKVVNTNFPKPFGWLTGYLAIIVGAGLTFVVQSSSVFTSSVTPLVGIGVVSLKRMYPLTLGSNIGTTTTGLLAALANTSNDVGKFQNGLQIALCHLFFNISGIIIWYPIPFMRNVPIKAAKVLGNTTAKYRWFALLYLFLVFFIIPGIILGLSFAHIWAMGGFLIFVGVCVAFIVIVNVLQSRKPKVLPEKMRTWKFLPAPMRSLKPYDKVFSLCQICKCCGRDEESTDGDSDKEGAINSTFVTGENEETKL